MVTHERLKEHLGELTLAELEDPDVINRFKTDSEYAEDVEIATMHRVLETLRAAMNWGMAPTAQAGTCALATNPKVTVTYEAP